MCPYGEQKYTNAATGGASPSLKGDRAKRFGSVFFLRIFREPALFDALLLLKEFENAPEAAHAEYGCEGARNRAVEKEGDCECRDAEQGKERPDLFADIVFALYDDGVKGAYHQKGTETDQEAVQIHGTSFLFTAIPRNESSFILLIKIDRMRIAEHGKKKQCRGNKKKNYDTKKKRIKRQGSKKREK